MKVNVFEIGGKGGRSLDRAFDTNDFPEKILEYKVGEIFPLANPDDLWKFIDLNDYSGDYNAVSIAGKNKDHKIMVNSPNLRFLNGVNIAAEAEGRTGKKTRIFNDMSTVAEALRALEQYCDELYWAVMTWSSGINGRIIKNGEIVDDNAELGHIISSLQYPPIDCKCGGANHLECLISGEAIKTMVINRTAELSIVRSLGMYPNEFLDEEYREDKGWAIDVYSYIAKIMAAFIATLKSFHPDLDLIVFKGGVAKARLERMKPLIYENLKTFAMPALNADKIRLELSTLPTDLDGLVGAAMALERMIEDGEL